MDHTTPRSLQGSDDLDNLALACHRCNERRNNLITAIDPQGKVQVSIFNPRKDIWSEHCCWSRDGIQIIGRTAMGRVQLANIHPKNLDHPIFDPILSITGIFPRSHSTYNCDRTDPDRTANYLVTAHRAGEAFG